jgi:serralysin
MATFNGTNGNDQLPLPGENNSGNDEFFALSGDDTVQAGAGMDTVDASDGADTVYGEAGADNLSGGADNDWLHGGRDNDFMDGGAGDDTLIGGVGIDTMQGNFGDDRYYVDDSGDIVTEFSADDGFDWVFSSVSFKLSQFVEDLTLSGTANINGSGNSDANTLTGNAGNNGLTGGAGNDTLLGGGGADTLKGGAGSDSLFGGDGVDWLAGGAGKDILTGGLNSDRFIFNSSNEAAAALANADVITDWQGADFIQVSAAGFGGGLVAGQALDSDQFRVDSAPVGSNGQFLYNTFADALLWDADGAGAGSSVVVAQFATNVLLNAGDIIVV